MLTDIPISQAIRNSAFFNSVILDGSLQASKDLSIFQKLSVPSGHSQDLYYSADKKPVPLYYHEISKDKIHPDFADPDSYIYGVPDLPYSAYRQAMELYIPPSQFHRLYEIDKCNIHFGYDQCQEHPTDPEHGTVIPHHCNDPLCPITIKDKRTEAFLEIQNKMSQTISYAPQWLTFTLPESISQEWWSNHYLLPARISKLKEVAKYVIENYITTRYIIEGKIDPKTEKIEPGYVVVPEYVGSKDIFKPHIHLNIILSDLVFILDKKTKEPLRKIHTPDRFWDYKFLSALYTMRFEKVFKTSTELLGVDVLLVNNKIIYKNELEKVIWYILKGFTNPFGTLEGLTDTNPNCFFIDPKTDIICYRHNGTDYPLTRKLLNHLFDLIPQGRPAYTWHGFYSNKKFNSEYVNPEPEPEPSASECNNADNDSSNNGSWFPDYEDLEKSEPLHTCSKCGAPTVYIGVCDGNRFLSYSGVATKEQIDLAINWITLAKQKYKQT